MKQIISLLFLGMFGASAAAQETEVVVIEELVAPEILYATDISLSDFLWLNRLIVVFADTERDPSFTEQMSLLQVRTEDLVRRDVVIIVDTDPEAESDIRLQLRPRGFSLVMIDLDGTVKLRKPSPWSTRELIRSIDKTQLRRDEMRQAR